MSSNARFPVSALLFAAGLFIAVPALACNGRLHIEVGPSGVYRLDYADAVAAQPGLAGCELDRLRLTYQGNEVPIRIIDRGEPGFDKGDAIEWIGRRLHGQQSWSDPYSRVNVYELDAADGQHRRFELRRAGAGRRAPATLSRHLHLESDRLMVRLKTSQVKPGEQPDVWYAAKMTMVDPEAFTTRFDLPGLGRHFANPALRIAFRGLSTAQVPAGKATVPDHRVIVRLNGRDIQTLDWDGDDHVERTLVLPAGLLRSHDNTLQLRVPERQPEWAHNPLVDVVMFDYLDIRYPLRDSIAGIHGQVRVDTAGAPTLTGSGTPLLFGSDGVIYQPAADADADTARYPFAPSGVELFPLGSERAPLTPTGLRKVADRIDWRNPGTAYDYLIIAHPSLMQAIEPLAVYHRRHGMKVAVINVNAAYDQFNHGIVNPNAIRDLLAEAHKHWPRPRPHYVLLVGDASFDIHDRLRDQKFYSKWTDRELLFPGHFGRIPGTPYADKPRSADARNLIPTFQYFAHEGQSASDNGFVAFGEDGIKPDMAIGRFPVIHPSEVTDIVDKILDYARHPRMGGWRQSVMFITNDDLSFQHTSDQLAATIGDMGFSPAKIYPKSSDKDNADHQRKIMRDLDKGQLLVHFLGHGGRYIWRTGPPDPRKNHDLFTLKDVGELNNAGRLPMVLSMTCYSAPFDNPTEDSIGEKFLREKHNGAIAVFAASWRNAPDLDFSSILLKDLVRPGITIGDAILKAKRSTSNPDMIEMYNLLGDPAIALQRPQQKLDMVQQRSRWASASAVAVRIPGASQFHGRVKVEWLDNRHRLLSRQVYRLDSPVFQLPPAPAHAHQVRAYAFDPQLESDALGELTLTPAPPVRHWWQPAPRKVPLKPASDRISGSNFGG